MVPCPLLVSGSAAAYADSTRVPIGAAVSVGVGSASQHDSFYEEDLSDAVLSAQLDIGYRFHDRAMAGVHVAFASGVVQQDVYPMSMFNYFDDYAYRPLQLGVGGLVMVHDRVYVSPWLGVQRGWREHVCDGILLDDHRVSVSASFTHAFLDQNDRFTYTSFSLSEGYRFWTR